MIIFRREIKTMLEKVFIKNYKNTDDPKVRNAYGVLAAAVGIFLNLLLSGAKIAVGLIFNSVAVLGDGFNNVTDAGSSVVNLLGFRWANKPADKDHPFGHARYEYITGLIIAFIVLFLGVELGRNSIEKIIGKGSSDASIITMTVLAASILVKVFMFFYYRKTAKKINSGSLHAAAVDSLNDTISTGAVLICAVVAYFAKIELDAYAGVLVAAFILANGIKLVKETMSPLLGEKPDPEFVKKIKDVLLSYDGVKGIHDLIAHNYGPNRYFASVHVEVDASVDIMKSHELIDGIEKDMLKHGVNMVIHMDPVIVNDERVENLKTLVREELKAIDPQLNFHDFRVVWGENNVNVIFDLVTPYGYGIKDEQLVTALIDRIKARDPKISLIITMDKDYTE